MTKATVLDIDGSPIAVEVRASRRARRLLLRVDQRREVVILTLPPFVSRREGLRFAEGHAAWIAERLAAVPPRVAFVPDAVIPYLGVPHRIRHAPDQRGIVHQAEGVLAVSGHVEHVPRRVADFLRRRARIEIEQRMEPYARRLGRRIGGLTLRDPTTRWGSCSPAGKLSFSWRLILAPPAILDYVVAHEVTHLEVFDHSPRFWYVLEHLVGDVAPAKAWLRQNGANLHRYG